MRTPVATLVVDDDEGVRQFLAGVLREAAYAVDLAGDGQEALSLLRDARYDLIVLDLNLGGRVDGLRVLEAIRWRWPDTAVIILTGHGSLESAVAAIREGVDAYLLKPIELDDLRHAIDDALIRRRSARLPCPPPPTSPVEVSSGISVDRRKHAVIAYGRPVDLTPREFGLLLHLMDNADRVVSTKELAHVLTNYEPDSIFEARDLVKWYIHHLRKKLEPEPSKPRHIINVRGVGYRYGE